MLTSGDESPVFPQAEPTRLLDRVGIDWFGQSAASIFWIGSVLLYGVSTAGDWLQLFAASSWLVANIATIASAKSE